MTPDNLLTADDLAAIKAGTLPANKLGTGRTSAYVITREAIERAKAEAAA